MYAWIFLTALWTSGLEPAAKISQGVRAPWAGEGISPNLAEELFKSLPPGPIRLAWGRQSLWLSVKNKSLLERGITIGPLETGKGAVILLIVEGKLHWGPSKTSLNPSLGQIQISKDDSVVAQIPWVELSLAGGRPEPGTKLWVKSSDQPTLPVVFQGPQYDSKAGPNLGPVSGGVLAWSGSPDPGLPYKTKPVFTESKYPFPVSLLPIPETNAFLISTQPGPYAQTALLYFDGKNPSKVRTVLELDAVIYDGVFHPDFTKNGYLYIGANGKFGKETTHKTRITRFETSQMGNFEIKKDTAKTIIEWESNGHNGGAVCFGNDGLMYITSGDGTSDSDLNLTGQDTTKLLAKVLRVDVDHPDQGKAYSVPKDNPWVGKNGFVPEAFAMGLRNPWRISCDKVTGNIWVGNNGQDLWETVYLLGKGDNYGWSILEGTHPFYPDRRAGPKPFAPPAAEHHHAEARSLTGGVVYHGKLFPDLRGSYIYGDYSSGKIWAIALPPKGAKLPLVPREIADTNHQITGFALDHQGELLILDHLTGIHTLQPNPMAGNRGTFPTQLSQSGLFNSVADYQLRSDILPYEVNSQLWSDGAFKARHFFVPDRKGKDGNLIPQSITHAGSGPWNFPDGTVLIKSFALELKKGVASSRTWIETRFLVKEDNEWTGYSFAWNENKQDATLVGPMGETRGFQVDRPGVDDPKPQQWRFPSRAECMVCHTRAAGFVLGLCDLQLNRDIVTEGKKVNQIAWIESKGKITSNWGNVRDYQLRERGKQLGQKDAALEGWVKARTPEKGFQTQGTLLESDPEKGAKLPNPLDPQTGSLEARVRAYLHVNCAPCHVEAGGGNSKIRLDFAANAAEMKLIGIKPSHHSFGLKDAELIAPNAPERSVLAHRITTNGDGKMPPLGRNVTDPDAVRLIEEWIRTLPPTKNSPPK